MIQTSAYNRRWSIWKAGAVIALSLVVVTGLFSPGQMGAVFASDAKEAGEKAAEEATKEENEQIQDIQEESSALQEDLSGINEELLAMSEQIAEVEEQIETTDGKIEMTGEQLAIAQNMEQQQYADMKVRIRYMYESGNDSWFELLEQSQGMTDFLNRLDFIQNISEYDREKLEEFQELQATIQDQKDVLADEQASQKELKEELAQRNAQLEKKAAETSTELSTLTEKISELKEEAAKKAAEAAAKAEAEALAKQKEEEAKKASESQTASSSYNMPTGDGVLTKYRGVNYYNGHRETYYSQRVLPGGGLNIPGRHVAEDGTIRDKDGYICVASSDYPKGTVVQTSLGPGKVYDSGCASGTIDLYTDW